MRNEGAKLQRLLDTRASRIRLGLSWASMKRLDLFHSLSSREMENLNREEWKIEGYNREDTHVLDVSPLVSRYFATLKFRIVRQCRMTPVQLWHQRRPTGASYANHEGVTRHGKCCV